MKENNKIPSNFKSIVVKHSGNIGDIIYSIPTVRSIVERFDKLVIFILETNVIANYPSNIKNHPSGIYRMTDYMAMLLKPLLEFQKDVIQKVIIFDTFKDRIQLENIKNDKSIFFIDLDLFRNLNLSYKSSHLAKYYFHSIVGAYYDISKPYLSIDINKIDEELRDSIIISRSMRYRNKNLNYSILNESEYNLYFVGVDEEYEDIKKYIPNIKKYVILDFLELASAIASCKLFIGNQSFPFALAEAIKKDRLLEVCFESENCPPFGGFGVELYYQVEFEYWVKKLLKNK